MAPNDENIGSTFWERFELLIGKVDKKVHVANKLGIDRARVTAWSKGDTIPEPKHFKAIQESYELTGDEMCYLHFGRGYPPARDKRLIPPGGEGGENKDRSGSTGQKRRKRAYEMHPLALG